ncbi:MAG: type II secretion system F family protein [Planctomycetes bacterium]|nr:type II secretion system F family protein [Planctomycetota bacterium]
MPTFSYKAVGQDGQSVLGSLTAENYQVALRMLEEKALYPVNVREGALAAKSIIGRTKKVKLRHLVTVYSQLSDLLRAGVPMLRALDVLSRQGFSATLTEILKDVREEVSGGYALADAMEKHPAAFSDLHCSMIRAGERGGFLEDVLSRLAGFAERQDELRNKVLGSMIYPAVLMGAGLAVITFLLTFVVPKLREQLREENYNILTKIVFGATDLLVDYYPYLIVAVVGLIVGVAAVCKSKRGKLLIGRVQLKAPVYGKIYTMMAVCRFCRILGTMLRNGVPILQSLKISKDSAGNPILADEIENAAESVRKGETLADPLGKSGLFPPDILDMIAVAEESNNLENVLIQIADTNEARTARQIDLGVRLLEPVLLMVMAGMVLCIALALLLPILTMSSNAMGGR